MGTPGCNGCFYNTCNLSALNVRSGVGPVAALSFKIGVDDSLRLTRSRTVGAHFGMTPRRHQSGTSIDYEGRIAAHTRFDGIEFADPAQRVGRRRRARRLGDFVECAPRMRPEGGENDISITGQPLEPRVTINMQDALEPVRDALSPLSGPARTDRLPPVARVHSTVAAPGHRPKAVLFSFVRRQDRVPGSACRRRADGRRRKRFCTIVRAALPAASKRRRPIRRASVVSRCRSGQRFATADRAACDRNIY